jgi:adenylate cyclase
LKRERAERRISAILAADIVGYSRLMGADDEGTLAQLKAHHNSLVEPKIKEHRGHIVRTTGDGLLVLFASVVEALRCAIENSTRDDQAECAAAASEADCVPNGDQRW